MNTQIFDWLGRDAAGVGYHLHALHPVWSDAGPEHDLAMFRAAAERLAAAPAYWAELIAAENWRFTLAGLTCLLAANRREFGAELAERFAAGSFVAPHLAVTLGLLHPEQARECLRGPFAAPRLAACAAAVRARLDGSPPPTPATDEDAEAAGAVERLWIFWSPRVGGLHPPKA